MKPRILFIHGMFGTGKCWQDWLRYFRALGYRCEAPSWPLHDEAPEILRKNIPPRLGDLSLPMLYHHYEDLVKQEGEPPVLIGHSMGGLVVQKLISQGLARAGVCISSVAPNRMLSMDWGFLRNTASITNPFAGDEPYLMTPALFHQNFCHTSSEEESALLYETYAVHESRQVLRNIMGQDGELDVTRPHIPLLFISAEYDQVIPPALVKKNAEAYTDERSHREVIEFSGRNHFLIGQAGWEEVALTIANWLNAHLHSLRS